MTPQFVVTVDPATNLVIEMHKHGGRRRNLRPRPPRVRPRSTVTLMPEGYAWDKQRQCIVRLVMQGRRKLIMHTRKATAPERVVDVEVRRGLRKGLQRAARRRFAAGIRRRGLEIEREAA